MAPPRKPIPAQTSVQVGKVTDLGDEFALVQDYFGLTRRVALSYRPAKGALPAIDEVWLIERVGGEHDWVFKACLSAKLVTVEGNVVEDSAQDALLQAMALLGFVEDDATRVSGGGDGGPDWARWMNVNP